MVKVPPKSRRPAGKRPVGTAEKESHDDYREHRLDRPAAGRGHGLLRADLCLYSPESYTLEEKRDICNEMISTSKAMLVAMREDFEQLPPDARSKLLDMRCQSGVESPGWWWDMLVGEGDPLYRELESLQ